MFTLDRLCQPRLTPRLTLPVLGEHSVLSPTEGCDIYILSYGNVALTWFFPYLIYCDVRRQYFILSHGNVALTCAMSSCDAVCARAMLVLTCVFAFEYRTSFKAICCKTLILIIIIILNCSFKVVFI